MRGYRRVCSYSGIRIIQLGYIVGAEASTYKGAAIGESSRHGCFGGWKYAKFKFDDQMFFCLSSGGRGREGGGPRQGGSCEGWENACILIDDGTTESGTGGIGVRS
jgi:hypothetical protein